MTKYWKHYRNARVAPFAGAWIEMVREQKQHWWHSVAPFAGAWIEILQRLICVIKMFRRSLRGSVD